MRLEEQPHTKEGRSKGVELYVRLDCKREKKDLHWLAKSEQE